MKNIFKSVALILVACLVVCGCMRESTLFVAEIYVSNDADSCSVTYMGPRYYKEVTTEGEIQSDTVRLDTFTIAPRTLKQGIPLIYVSEPCQNVHYPVKDADGKDCLFSYRVADTLPLATLLFDDSSRIVVNLGELIRKRNNIEAHNGDLDIAMPTKRYESGVAIITEEWHRRALQAVNGDTLTGARAK